VTTAPVREWLSGPQAGNSPRGRDRRESRLRLPETWPLLVLFLGFPIWWALGLSALIWPVFAVPMLVALIWRQRTKAPAAIGFWFAFCAWVLMSGLQLGIGTKLVTFSYRLSLYVCAGILFVYVYNMPRSDRMDARILRILTGFWMIVVLGGYVGMIGGAHTFTALFEYLLPDSLRNQPFVQELVQPVLGTVTNFLGFPVSRPAAPFAYTNNWGGNMAVLTPVALAAIAATRAGARRKLIIAVLFASLVPMVVSLNRGMFLSLAIGLAYVMIRMAVRGRVAGLMSLLGLLALAAILVVVTPLGHIVAVNATSTHGYSNATRASVEQQAFDGANQSPIFGHGEPQPVTGQMAGTPPIGTQGQLWMILYSNGYVATALFFLFYLTVLWQTRHARGTAGLWLQAVPIIALAHTIVYGWLPVEIQVVMVIAALAYRRSQHATALEPASAPSAPPIKPLAWREQRRLDRRRLSATGSAAQNDAGVGGTTAVVLRGSVLNLVAMVAGAAMSFGLVVLVSRWLQPRGTGVFFELIAVFTILSNTLELGADTGLTRWISRARAIGGLSDVRRIVPIAIVPVLVVGTAGAIAIWFTAPQLAALFLHGVPPGVGAQDIRIIAPLIPLGALSACIIDGARGFGRMWPYQAIEGFGKPAARIVLVMAVLASGLGLHAAIVAWGLPVVAGLAVGCIIFAALLRKEVPRGLARGARPGSSADPEPRSRVRIGRQGRQRDGGRGPTTFPSIPELDATVELPVVFDPVTSPSAGSASAQAGHTQQGTPENGWGDGEVSGKSSKLRPTHRPVGYRSIQLAAEFWSFTGPRAFQATFQVIILWLDILIVGAIASAYQAGIYSAVSKLAIVGTFALEGNRLAIAPQLSALLARHENLRAARLYQSATRWLILASWPLYLVFAVFPAVVLGIFGPRYVAGASALAVLSLAMLVNLGTGNVTVVLLMGGRSTWSALNAGAALIVNIGLNLLLVPRIGILGAAIAWAASIIVDNVTAMIEIRWVLGLAPFGPGYWHAATATLTCFGLTGVVARLALGQTLPALGAAAVAGLGAFAVTLYLGREKLQVTGLGAALIPRRAKRWVF
jgi:polysaccharide biosynthesis protein PslJ